ncbi:acyltransferase [Pikeienuella piscinae]|uniref:Acyltransferase n=1 Tax=Pikeienuella piscinae TaxID=2748098 RepID=A0A7L5BUM7_9RHOB|nr:lysophospholipid acyltransferase family protein [Pikeienuella piscinae]QIE54428.1 acyltransferase [Pikeienuella piscinae]
MRGATDHLRRTPGEISYAYSARSRAGRVVIRSIENLTGRPRLIRMALGYETEVSAGRDFWEVMTERYRVHVELGRGGLERIPVEGPLVIVANHPFGILDGMAMGRILSARRPHFRIVAHKIFHRARELEEMILPISFDETRAAQMVNLETRRQALAYLAGGGAIGIFPGGTVSTAKRPFGRPMDPAWRNFTARLVSRSGAHVVPVYFHGANSRMFQIASHLHPTLRVALLIKEFGARVGGAIQATIGAPLAPDAIRSAAGDPARLMDYLRDATYSLSPAPLDSLDYGFEFEPAYAARRRDDRRSDAV